MRVFVLFETVFWVIIRVQQTSTLLPGFSVLLARSKIECGTMEASHTQQMPYW